MTSRFDDSVALSQFNSPLDLRVYTSRLMGQDNSLVLHGGGNTSVKIDDVLYVKGSGWDLGNIEVPGFSPVDMDVLLKMAQYESLSDTDMVKEQRDALKDASAPNPSIEAILHAIIPFRYVDHTHADAVVTITNTPGGKERIREIYGENMLIIDYVMPGFVLAKVIYEKTKDIDWNSLEGIILLNHGVFTFDDDAKKSYEKMIAVVDRAEAYLAEHAAVEAAAEAITLKEGFWEELQHAVSRLRGCEVVMKPCSTAEAVEFSLADNLEDILSNGPLTPEHVIRTKPFPAVIDGDVSEALERFERAYQGYFDAHRRDEIRLDPAPRYAVIKGFGFVALGKDDKEASAIYDIVEHTVHAMLCSQKLGGWKSLKPSDIFDMEYWELEQAKLKK